MGVEMTRAQGHAMTSRMRDRWSNSWAVTPSVTAHGIVAVANGEPSQVRSVYYWNQLTEEYRAEKHQRGVHLKV